MSLAERFSRIRRTASLPLIGFTLMLAVLQTGAAAGPAPAAQARAARTPPGHAGCGLAPHVEGELLIKFRPSTRAADRAIARQRGNPHIEYIEPNYLVRAAATPGDPRYPDQWSLRNTGQTGGIPGADIDAEAAWEIKTGSRDVITAGLSFVTVSNGELRLPAAQVLARGTAATMINEGIDGPHPALGEAVI